MSGFQIAELDNISFQALEGWFDLKLRGYVVCSPHYVASCLMIWKISNGTSFMMKWHKKHPFFKSFWCQLLRPGLVKNRVAVICVCTAVLLKYRCKKFNLFQKVLSLVLYASQCSKKVSLIELLTVMKMHQFYIHQLPILIKRLEAALLIPRMILKWKCQLQIDTRMYLTRQLII